MPDQRVQVICLFNYHSFLTVCGFLQTNHKFTNLSTNRLISLSGVTRLQMRRASEYYFMSSS